MKPRHLLFLVLALAVILPCTAGIKEKYSQVRIPVISQEEMIRLHSLGIPLDHVGGRPGAWVDVFVSASQLDRLRRSGIAFTVLIEDWQAHYAERLRQDRSAPPRIAAGPPVAHFRLGSMAGHLTLAELTAELDSMRTLYPSLVTTRDSIGASIENRPIWAVKISASADLDEAEPRALYTGLHHAREPAGMMTLVYFMWYLLENYGTDQEVTDLLDGRELYFVPVVNPDGYLLNQTNEPAGGGMWRKNVRLNPDGTLGVDLNRNYGFQWGYDDDGSSPVPDYEDYRGTDPFSEPETRALRDLAIAKRFTVGLNYHTFSNLLIYPWGYSDGDTPDSVTYRRWGEEMTAVNRYSYGTGGQTVGYITNGDADDWLYGDTLSKPKVFSMTPEVGNNLDYFWATPSRILPLAQENLTANLYLAHAAGEFVGLSKPVAVDDNTRDSLWLNLRFIDKGRVPPPPTINLVVQSGDVTIIDGVKSGVAWQTESPAHVIALRKPGAQAGDIVTVTVWASYVGGSSADTISFRLGPSQVLYADDAEGTRSRWTSWSNAGTGWDTTSSQARSGLLCFTDSPGGLYPNTFESAFSLDSAFYLVGRAAELRFWTKWLIESNYDFARVEISADNGATWTALAGRYTAPGAGKGAQSPVFSPGYDAVKHTWVEEVIDLSSFLGTTPVLFRFRMASDQDVSFDGMYVDDIRLLLYGPPAAPQILAWPSAVACGAAEVGALPETSMVRLQNLGSADLVLSAVDRPNLPFEIVDLPALPHTIPAAGMVWAHILFHPDEAGSYSDSIVFSTNDPVNPTLTVTLAGTGFVITPARVGTLYAFGGVQDSARVRIVDPATGSTAILGRPSVAQIKGARIHPRTLEMLGIVPASTTANLVRISSSADCYADSLFVLSGFTWKGMEFYNDTLFLTRQSHLFRVDMENGTATRVAAFPTRYVFSGIAHRPGSNELLATVSLNTPSADSLYRINLTDYTLTRVGKIGTRKMMDILFDDQGRLFGVISPDTGESMLVQIDTATAAVAILGPMGATGIQALAGRGTFTSVKQVAEIPTEFTLSQNYPNPFNPATTIQYGIVKTEDVKLAVFDLLGREVAMLVQERKPAGRYEVRFDGAHLSSGVYFYRLQAGAHTATKRMVIVR